MFLVNFSFPLDKFQFDSYVFIYAQPVFYYRGHDLSIYVALTGGLGNWSDRGCRLINFEAGRAKCHCDHMTNFAVLFSASGPKTHEKEHAMALSIISYVGCAISLAGLSLTLITYSMFRYAKCKSFSIS